MSGEAALGKTLLKGGPHRRVLLAAAFGLTGALALLLSLPGSPFQIVFRKPVAEADQNVFAPRLEDVAPERAAAFKSGARMFTEHWIVRVPGPDIPFDGLGPVFNQTSCLGCHVNGGRGQSPERHDEPMESMVVRISVPGATEDSVPLPHPIYGDQLNDRSIPGVAAEGRAIVEFDELRGIYADGSAYNLRQPRYRFVDLAFGPLEGVLISARVAQPVIGLGLLEAVSSESLQALADPDDADGNGISGRVNWIVDRNGHKVAGRFGWKATHPTLSDQAASAGLNDMGLTSYVLLEPNCPSVQQACRTAAVRPRPDMSDKFFDNLIAYLQMSIAPDRREEHDPAVLRGEALFTSFGCAQCHAPQLETGDDAPLPELRKKVFHAFTDLLVHDMGDGLADHRPDGSASGSEWRTAPLWGIGLTSAIGGPDRFLHDGRARGLHEAILWHGGEAEPAREAFRRASADERDALISFLQSL